MKLRFWTLAYACRLYQDRFPQDKGFNRRGIREIDLRKTEDGDELLRFLNDWGMRIGLESFDDKRRALERWWSDWNKDLVEYADLALVDAEDVSLAQIVNSHHALTEIDGIGLTGASKILFALLPRACPAWDRKMQKGLHANEQVTSYEQWLQHARLFLQQMAADASRVLKKETPVNELPKIVGRPGSSPPKIVDEFYWIKYTAGHKAPSVDDLQNWVAWAE